MHRDVIVDTTDQALKTTDQAPRGGRHGRAGPERRCDIAEEPDRHLKFIHGATTLARAHRSKRESLEPATVW